ncbi:hypothetical protein AMTRI_Chr06g179230 [Amborella trichopoda]
MDAQCQAQAPLVEDLKVTIERSSIVLPFEKTPRSSMFLSNIDQILTFNVETVHFFPANPEYHQKIVVELFESALSRLLVPYDFMAGRLHFNEHSRRFEIDCNSAGAEFIVASSDLTFLEIGDLVYPNPAFRQFVPQLSNSKDLADLPLCLLQVTWFKCGGFVMGLSTNHATFDGISAKTFIQNLASLTASTTLAVQPYTNREPLRARSPPLVSFPHPELFEFPSLHSPANLDNGLIGPPAVAEDHHFKVFRLTGEDIDSLKQKARQGGALESCTSFNVVAAHLWRCKTLATGRGNEQSTLLYAVDIRRKLKPPLPHEYAGNAVLAAYAIAELSELRYGTFSNIVEKVWEGPRRIDDEYARSVIDWGEEHRGVPRGDIFVSSWWRLGLSEVDYVWGRPKYTCPVVHATKDIILLFPDIQGMSSSKGVNCLVALPEKEMEVFQKLFKDFLNA